MQKFVTFFLMVVQFVFSVAYAQEATLTLGRPLIDIHGNDALMYNPNNYEVIVFPDAGDCPSAVEFPTEKGFTGHRIPAQQLADNINPESLGYAYPLKRSHGYAVGGYTRLRPDAFVLTTECSTFTADPGLSPYFAPTFDQVPDAKLMTKVIDIVSMPRSGGYYIGFSKGLDCAALITDATRVFRLGDRERISTKLHGGPYWSYGVYQKYGKDGFKKVTEQCTPIDVRYFTGYEEATPMPPIGAAWVASTGQIVMGLDTAPKSYPGVSLLLQPLRIGSPKFGLSLALQLSFNGDTYQPRYIKPTASAGVLAGYSWSTGPKLRWEAQLGLLGGAGAFGARCESGVCAGSGTPVTFYGPQVSPLLGLSLTTQVKQVRVGAGIYATNQIWVTNPNTVQSVDFTTDDNQVVSASVRFSARVYAEPHVVFPALVVQW